MNIATETVKYGAMPGIFTGNESVKSNQTTASLRETRYLFFAGDVIPTKIKYADTYKSFGGIHLPRFKTFAGYKKMLFRCTITEMKPKNVPIPTAMMPPDKRKEYPTSYIQQRATTEGMKDFEITSPNSLFMEFLPGNEIQYALTPEAPYGEGGTVEIKALRGKNVEVRDEAQEFYFPNWQAIQLNQASLPATPALLKRHLENRRSAVKNSYSGEDRVMMENVGDDMIRSCDEFSNWGKEYIKSCESELEKARTLGHAYTFPPVAELVMEQLGLVRKDELAADSTYLMRESASDSLLEQKRANDLKERELALKEQELALLLGKAKPTEKVANVAAETRTCNGFAKTGEPCGSPASREIDGVAYCRHHPSE